MASKSGGAKGGKKSGKSEPAGGMKQSNLYAFFKAAPATKSIKKEPRAEPAAAAAAAAAVKQEPVDEDIEMQDANAGPDKASSSATNNPAALFKKSKANAPRAADEDDEDVPVKRRRLRRVHDEGGEGEGGGGDDVDMGDDGNMLMDGGADPDEDMGVGWGGRSRAPSSVEMPKISGLAFDKTSPSQDSPDDAVFVRNPKLVRALEKERKEHRARDRVEEHQQRLLSCKAALTSPMFAEYVETFYSSDDGSRFPSWLNPMKIKDKRGRSPFDDDYDPSSMRVPSPLPKDEKAHATPAMAQYWDFKKDNFDKVLFFKMGRFYEIFYIDAFIAARVCGLQFMNDQSKPHCGFPEQALHRYASEMVEAGYKVSVIEQMETPKERDERNKATGGKKDKVVDRQVCEVYTQGTLVHDDMLSPDAKYLLALSFEDPSMILASEGRENDGNTDEEADPLADPLQQQQQQQGEEGGGSDDDGSHRFGFCFVDVASCKIMLGHMRDDQSRLKLSTLLAQVMPVEVVYDPATTPVDVVKLIRMLPAPPQMSPNSNFPSLMGAEAEVDRYFPMDSDRAMPQALQDGRRHPSLLCAFGGICDYLRKNLLDEKERHTQRNAQLFADIETYDPFNQRHLIMDATVLRNLEILQTQEGTEKGSLFHFLNHTSTNFGKRLFKRWLCSPLCQERLIDERLDCVDWLMHNDETTGRLAKEMSKLPDVERMLAKTCQQGLRGERGAVYFDDETQKRTGEFIKLLDAFDKIQDMVERFFSGPNAVYKRSGGGSKEDAQPQPLPRKLEALTKLQSADAPEPGSAAGMFPNLKEKNAQLKAQIDTRGDVYKPARGADEEYEEVQKRIRQIEKSLSDELKTIAREWRIPSAKFVDSKHRYEVEVPEKSVDRQSVDVTSSKKGYVRFHTPEIKRLIGELEDEEESLKNSYYPFLQRLFREFYEAYDFYCAAVRITAEIDCLISLAKASLGSGDGPMCRPEFVEWQEGEAAMLELRECRHPTVAAQIPNFIPNDTCLNTGGVDGGVLLVTGPNMGGKSTVLRQTCIAVIMAQLGTYVPASSCRLTCVDKIFTRIGAHDAILEGKSTFLVELEETCQMLQRATPRSLAVIDELGRGTSTFDGTAIALAALEYIAKTLKCRCLFSTHFHLLCEEFRGIPEIINFHMAADVNDDTGDVTFLYKFQEGACPKSHGMHVARLAGIPDNVLRAAAEKSRELEVITTEFYQLTRCRKVARQLLGLISTLAGDDPAAKDRAAAELSAMHADYHTPNSALHELIISSSAAGADTPMMAMDRGGGLQ
ncbi:unnamed protein product [Vitrella brassicaformis CCMP3155]|uniref:DNA mismatch repair protein n=3 Tax=Vitrella brassicaformis TaxID=1169539 RepID=A0A0G4FHS3_VITBC|nr:unnamed protein product [Vitrella brassicaformis CCMP3155]|eukprot:CEM12621.1 unnamed protein product [Vitrella brassicaformis CCMP3155]